MTAGMDGLALTRKLKRQDRLKGVAIIAFTAFALTRGYLKAFEAGCDGCITKPIGTRRLAREVRAFLEAVRDPDRRR